MKSQRQLSARVGRSLFLCGVIAVFTVSATAKRLAPKPVPPIVANGIRYSAEGNGEDEYVVAQDVSTKKVLWKVNIFHNQIDPWMERDVQDVYINELKLNDKTLFVMDEKSRCYSVDLATHDVKKRACVLRRNSLRHSLQLKQAVELRSTGQPRAAVPTCVAELRTPQLPSLLPPA